MKNEERLGMLDDALRQFVRSVHVYHLSGYLWISLGLVALVASAATLKPLSPVFVLYLLMVAGYGVYSVLLGYVFLRALIAHLSKHAEAYRRFLLWVAKEHSNRTMMIFPVRAPFMDDNALPLGLEVKVEALIVGCFILHMFPYASVLWYLLYRDDVVAECGVSSVLSVFVALGLYPIGRMLVWEKVFRGGDFKEACNALGAGYDRAEWGGEPRTLGFGGAF